MSRESARRAGLLLLGALALGACDGRRYGVDAGADGGATGFDAGPMPMADAQARVDAQTPPGTDGGPPSTEDAAALDASRPPTPDLRTLPVQTDPAPASEVVREGAGGLLLRGTVLTPGGPLEGEVLVVGDTITCVAPSCAGAAMADTVTVIDTHAVISPGLIDGHNHLTYNFLDEWVPDPLELFMSRYEWRSEDDYKTHTFPESFGGNRGDFVCPATKWAELRSIIHGTTTVQGQSPQQRCVERLARNADHYHGLGSDHLRTTISGACESSVDDDWRAGVVSSFDDGSTTRLAIHMAEGVGGGGSSTMVLQELDCYAGRERFTTSLLERPDGTPYETSLFIHAVPFADADIMEAVDAGARFVWSPSSNLLLYGQTAPIEQLIERDAVIGLGPDWTLSGADEILTEMRYAYGYGDGAGIASLTPRRIWQMATYDGADALGLADALGRIEVGYRADLVVFGRVGDDPYAAVLDSRAQDVRLVTIDGAAYYGDTSLSVAAVNGSCDTIDACGSSKFLCVANTPGSDSRANETLGDIETQLREHIAAADADPDDTVDRSGQAPLPLIDCRL